MDLRLCGQCCSRLPKTLLGRLFRILQIMTSVDWHTYFQPVFSNATDGSRAVWRQLARQMASLEPAALPTAAEDVRTWLRSVLAHLGHFAVVVRRLNAYVNQMEEGASAAELHKWWTSEARGDATGSARHYFQLRSLQPLQGVKVLLHSQSSAVKQLLRVASNEEVIANTQIFQAIGHPANEGKLQAESLRELAYQVHLIEDAAVGKYLTQCDYVLLGADVITKHSFVNKIGSMPLCAAAYLLKVPVYVVAEPDKCIDESALPESVLDKLLVEEVQAGETDLFEHVPVQWVNGFIFPHGVVVPDGIDKLIVQQDWNSTFLQLIRQ